MNLQDFPRSGTCSRLSLGLALDHVDVFSGYRCLQSWSTSCYVKAIKLLGKKAEYANPNKDVAFNMLSLLPSLHGIFLEFFPLRPMEFCCCQKKQLHGLNTCNPSLRNSSVLKAQGRN